MKRYSAQLISNPKPRHWHLFVPLCPITERAFDNLTNLWCKLNSLNGNFMVVSATSKIFILRFMHHLIPCVATLCQTLVPNSSQTFFRNMTVTDSSLVLREQVLWLKFEEAPQYVIHITSCWHLGRILSGC